MMDVEGGYLFKPGPSKWQEKLDARLSVEKTGPRKIVKRRVSRQRRVSKVLDCSSTFPPEYSVKREKDRKRE